MCSLSVRRRALCVCRLLSEHWAAATPDDQKLRVLQCIRLLLRASAHQREFVAVGGMAVLCAVFKQLSEAHFAPPHTHHTHTSFNASLLIECTSILQKLVRHARTSM